VALKSFIFGNKFIIWVDTGSPNTLVSANFLSRFKLAPVGSKRYNGKVAGIAFRNRPSVTIPEIAIPGGLPLKNVRALAAMEGDEWDNTVVLGLNVLNHLTYKVSRDNRSFEWLESLTSSVERSNRSRLDHIIWNGTYLLSDDV
jgi:hypothetical protein